MICFNDNKNIKTKHTHTHTPPTPPPPHTHTPIHTVYPACGLCDAMLNSTIWSSSDLLWKSFFMVFGWTYGGVILIWYGWGGAIWASKPLPIFKGHFGRKRYPFLGICFEKHRPIFHNLQVFTMLTSKNFWLDHGNRLIENRTHV